MATTYTLISSNTLSSSQASVTFSSIPSTYTDLVIKVSARTANANIYDGLFVSVNGVANYYSYTVLRGTGSAADSFRASSVTYGMSAGYANGDTSTSNTFGSIDIYLPNYANSQNKVMSSFAANENNGTTAWTTANASLWSSTSAISSIVIGDYLNGNNLLSGSSFWLYGIKNS